MRWAKYLGFVYFGDGLMKRGSAAFLTAASLLAAMLWGLGFVMTSPVSAAPSDGGQQPADDGKLRIICFGAHPDDCELQISGTAALWTAQGHHVKFVSVTNGDIGHWREAGGPLAQRRKDEVTRGRRQAAHCQRSARHPRRRIAADLGEPPHHHSADPRVERRPGIQPSAERLSSRPSLHRACWCRTRPIWSRCLSSAPTCRT